MKITPTSLPDVYLVEPRVFGDERGFLFESYHADRFEAAVGRRPDFVQDNHSRSERGVLRGLHYQIRQPQGKLVRTVVGRVFDVAVDLRKSSAAFGRWFGVELSAENRRQLWVPEGFAHGFLVLSDHAEVVYKTTDFYAPAHERTILWNDADLGIDWPHMDTPPTLSARDRAGVAFAAADHFE